MKIIMPRGARIKIIGAAEVTTSRVGDTVEIDTEAATIDGIPYAPPAPEPAYRWTLEAKFAGGAGWCHVDDMDAGPNVKARALLTFDAQGRVWFADKKARELADFLLSLIKIRYAGTSFERVLREAALRLAGPEPDAT